MKHTLSLFILCTSGVCFAATAFAQEVEFEEYVVKKGDTCTSIARQFYKDPHAYDNIHNYNDLSAYDYACVEGIKLKLPILPKKPEAQLTSRYGKVRARSPQIDWKTVDVGAAFYPSWKVNTLTDSSAEIGFGNDTSLKMSENTLVVIYGPDKESAAVSSLGRASVERGRLKSFLNSIGNQPLIIETPSAKAEVNNGAQIVNVDDNEDSTFSNLDGEPLGVSSPDGKNKVIIKKGYGSRVKKNTPPEKPRKLPLPPKWAPNIETNGLVFGTQTTNLRASWEPTDTAESYRVELSRDRRQLDLVFSQNVPNKITNIELKDLPKGNYYLTVVSVDKDKFESIPSKTLQLTVHGLTVPGDYSIPDSFNQVILGSPIIIPKKIHCAFKGQQTQQPTQTQQDEHNLIVTDKSLKTITCDIDQQKFETNIEVVTPTFHLKEPDEDGSTSLIKLFPSNMIVKDLEFAPLLPPQIEIESNHKDFLTSRWVRTSPTTIQVAISTQNAPVGSYKLPIKTFNDELGTLDIEVAEPIPAEQRVATGISKFPSLYAVAALGYDSMLSFRAGSPLGGTLELGVGSFTNPFFTGEFRFGFGYYLKPKEPASVTKNDMILSARIQLMPGYHLKPVAGYAILGGLWRGFITRPDFLQRAYLTLGLGAAPYLTDSILLRIEADVAIGPFDNQTEYLPEARIAVQYLF